MGDALAEPAAAAAPRDAPEEGPPGADESAHASPTESLEKTLRAYPLAVHAMLALAAAPLLRRASGSWLAVVVANTWYLSRVHALILQRAIADARAKWLVEQQRARDADTAERKASESVAWLNAVLTAAWPAAVAPPLCAAIERALNPRLATRRPGMLRALHIERLHLGAAPPTLSAARALSGVPPATAADGGASVELEVELNFVADDDMLLLLQAELSPAGAPLRVPLHVRQLRVHGLLRLRLSGLQGSFPFVRRLRVAFAEAPALSFSMTPITRGLGVDVAHLPGLSEWLDGALRGVLREHATEPNPLVVNLAARVGAAPKAAVRARVRAVRGLPAEPRAEPYVRVSLNNAAAAETARAPRRGAADGASWEARWAAAEGDAGFSEFTVLSWDRCRLRLDVLGWRAFAAPVRLGSHVLDVRAAIESYDLPLDGAPRTLTLPLGGALPGAGRAAPTIEVDVSVRDVSHLTAIALSQERAAAEAGTAAAAAAPSAASPQPAAADAASGDAKQAAAPAIGPFARAAPPAPCVAQVEVTVLCARRLRALVDADPFVRLEMGQHTVDTGVRRRMIDPDFDSQAFTFRLPAWSAGRLRVRVLGWNPYGDYALLGKGELDVEGDVLTGRIATTGGATFVRLPLIDDEAADEEGDAAADAQPREPPELDITVAVKELTHAPLPRAAADAAAVAAVAEHLTVQSPAGPASPAARRRSSAAAVAAQPHAADAPARDAEASEAAGPREVAAGAAAGHEVTLVLDTPLGLLQEAADAGG